MAKKADTAPKKMGRPKSSNPLSEFVGLRLDSELFKAAEAYRDKNKLDDISSAIRHMMRRMIDQEEAGK